MKIGKSKSGLLFISLLTFLMAAAVAKGKDPWQQWLKEVAPIKTRLEGSVAKLLETLEERKRFREMFWKARDPNPHTPQNEYKIEYYRRVDYAKRRLGGTNSDRGRMYIILGKPFEIENYSGHSDLVECEIWSYRTGGRNGLFPFMNLVFFKRRNTGDYRLYHPGIHQPGDLLSPVFADNIRSRLGAYRELKTNSATLAQASLSIIPGEGDPRMNTSLSSSNFALNKIYSLPEREAESGYLRNFKSPVGSVQVSHSTNEIRGFGYITVSRNKSVSFVNYAIMPDKLNLKQSSEDLYTAEINLIINIEDLQGNLIYQNQRKVDLKVDAVKKRSPRRGHPISRSAAKTAEAGESKTRSVIKKQEIDKRRILFMNFDPIIEGDFYVTVTFINKTTQEFFTCKEKISVKDKALTALMGFKLESNAGGDFPPFSSDRFVVYPDPRSIFNQKDTLEGIIFTDQIPEIYLQDPDNKARKVKIESVVRDGDIYTFRHPLAKVKDENYLLTIKTPDGQTVTRKVHVLPAYISIERPLTMVNPEPAAALTNYIFVQAQQYLDSGLVDRSIVYFNKIPRRYWNAASLPFIARAYYKKKDYARVLELLERDEVEKVYSTLLLLANSAIELKKYSLAVEYLEKLRKYGDTVKINQLLAATYLCLGKQDKAKIYYEKARKLREK